MPDVNSQGIPDLGVDTEVHPTHPGIVVVEDETTEQAD